MTSAAKHTAGAAKVREFPTVFEVRAEDGVRIVTTSWHDNSPWHPTKDEARANVHLIAEAFTVAHETGLTPRQLAERCKELEAALAEARDYLIPRAKFINGNPNKKNVEHILLDRVEDALAKTGGAA
jgi:hypothetical protein